MATELIKKMRERLRIKSEVLDSEISDNMQSGIMELKRVGIAEPDLTIPLLFTCIEFYCKWLMGFEGEAVRYEQAFEKLRDALSLSGEYKDETDKQETNGTE